MLYAKPQETAKLHPFCSSETGVTDANIEGASPLQTTLEQVRVTSLSLCVCARALESERRNRLREADTQTARQVAMCVRACERDREAQRARMGTVYPVTPPPTHTCHTLSLSHVHVHAHAHAHARTTHTWTLRAWKVL